MINAFIVKRTTKLAVFISCAAILDLLYSLRIFKDFFSMFAADYHVHKVFTWFDLDSVLGAYPINMGIYIDNMTAVMLLMVSVLRF